MEVWDRHTLVVTEAPTVPASLVQKGRRGHKTGLRICQTVLRGPSNYL